MARGKKAGGGGGGAKIPNDDMQNESDPLGRIHEVIYAMVQQAVRPVMQADNDWAEPDITKKIVKYIYKAATAVWNNAAPQLWEESCKEFVETAMAPCGNTCSEAAWFLSIELDGVFARIGWMLLSNRGPNPPSKEKVEEVVLREYDECMNRILLGKGMWEAVATVFSHLEDKAKNKVYQSLTKTYWLALEAAVSLDSKQLEHSDHSIVVDQWMVPLLIGSKGATMKEMQEKGQVQIRIDQATAREGYSIVRIGEEGVGDAHAAQVVREKIQEFQASPRHNDKGILFGALEGDDGSAGDLRRVHAFYRHWVKESMGRCWAWAEGSLTHDNLIALFDILVAPFGDRHPFTCVPAVLIHRIGAPPPGWPFVPVAVQEFMQSVWESSWGEPSSKRRKMSRKRWEDWNGGGAPGASGKGISPNGGAGTDGPHPKCTSGEECIGTRQEKLVQHVLDGKAEDMYCMSCWLSFVERNPDLEGVVQD